MQHSTAAEKNNNKTGRHHWLLAVTQVKINGSFWTPAAFLLFMWPRKYIYCNYNIISYYCSNIQCIQIYKAENVRATVGTGNWFVCRCALVLAMCSWILLINARTHPRDRAEEKYNKTSLGKVKVTNTHIYTHMHEQCYETLCAVKSARAYTYSPSGAIGAGHGLWMCYQGPALSSTLHSVSVTPSPVLSVCLSLTLVFSSRSLCLCMLLELCPAVSISVSFSLSPSLSTAFGCVYVPAIGRHFLINIHPPPAAYCVCLNANQFLWNIHWPTYGFRATAPPSKLLHLTPLVLRSFPLFIFPFLSSLLFPFSLFIIFFSSFPFSCMFSSSFHFLLSLCFLSLTLSLFVVSISSCPFIYPPPFLFPSSFPLS